VLDGRREPVALEACAPSAPPRTHASEQPYPTGRPGSLPLRVSMSGARHARGVHARGWTGSSSRHAITFSGVATRGTRSTSATARAVRAEEDVLGELGAPREHRRDDRGVQRGARRAVAVAGEVEARAEVRGVQHRPARVHDLEEDLDEVFGYAGCTSASAHAAGRARSLGPVQRIVELAGLLAPRRIEVRPRKRRGVASAPRSALRRGARKTGDAIRGRRRRREHVQDEDGHGHVHVHRRRVDAARRRGGVGRARGERGAAPARRRGQLGPRDRRGVVLRQRVRPAHTRQRDCTWVARGRAHVAALSPRCRRCTPVVLRFSAVACWT
jgi:hypothetical protein